MPWRFATGLLLLLLCIVPLMSACSSAPQNTTFSFGGVEYFWTRTEVDKHVFSSMDGAKTISLRRMGNSSAHSVMVEGSAYVVNAFRASDGRLTVHAFVPSGREMHKIVDAKRTVTYSEGSEQDRELLNLFELIVPHDDVAHRARPRPLESLALGSLFAAYGVFQLLLPERAWLLGRWWMFKKVELSALHIGILRLTGLIFAILGVGLVAHAVRTFFGQ